MPALKTVSEDANASQGFRVCPRTSKEFGNTGGAGVSKAPPSNKPRAQHWDSKVIADNRIKDVPAKQALFATMPMQPSLLRLYLAVSRKSHTRMVVLCCCDADIYNRWDKRPRPTWGPHGLTGQAVSAQYRERKQIRGMKEGGRGKSKAPWSTHL